MSDFFKELQRRKVIRTATAYAVAAFVIMQIVEIVFPMFEIPNWAGRMVIILLSLGFPLVLIVAWIFDRTPEGKIEKDKQDHDLRPLAKKKRSWFAAAGIMAGLLLGVILSSTYYSDGLTKTVLNDKSIAVLPFTPFTISEEDQSFADGMHDDILTQLSKIKDINVISRTSVVQYKNTEKTMGEIAKELNVVNILEGSVRRAGNQIRIVAQLINAVNDKHIWSETYDRDYADIFSIQSDVAKKIAAALRANLSPSEIRYIEEKPTQNMEAYDYFLKGKHFWNTKSTKEGNQKAVDMFNSAAKLDPDFALAYAWSSIANSVLYTHLLWDHTQERKKSAKKALDLALALDPDHAKVHFAKGVYADWCLNDNNAALKEFEIAFKAEPGNNEIVRHLGNIYSNLGYWDRAEESLLKAYELDPVGFLNALSLGRFYRFNRQFEKSEYYYNLAIQSNPEHPQYYWGRALNYIGGFGNIDKARSLIKVADINVTDPADLNSIKFDIEFYSRDYSKAFFYAQDIKKNNKGTLALGQAYYFLGQTDQGLREFESLRVYYEKIIKDDPDNAELISRLGLVYAYLGLKDKALSAGKMGLKLQSISNDHVNGPFRLLDMTFIYILTGEQELAIDNLEYLLSIPSYVTKWELRLNPDLDPLRQNQRFQKLAVVNK